MPTPMGLPSVAGGQLGRYGQPMGGTGQPGSTGAQDKSFLGSGPFWVLVFLAVGYVLVFQTLRD